MQGLKTILSRHHGLCSYTKVRQGASSQCPQSIKASSGSFMTLAQPTQMTIEVKKSKFITTAWPVSSPHQALELIQGASNPEASHNCWAYMIGSEYRSTDDGEPSGTAGRPILSAIQGEGLDGTCVLVTRFFGGIKLGPGGLARAYANAARECLRAAPKQTLQCMVRMQLVLPYKTLGSIYGQMEKLGIVRAEDEEYLDDGSVKVIVLVSEDKEAEFYSIVSDMTAGAIVPTHCSQSEVMH